LTQYVDTSILAAYYCPEPLSERAEQRLRELRPPTISWLTDVELHSALAKKVRMNELAEGDAERIHDLFRTHVTRELYDIVEVERADFCAGPAVDDAVRNGASNLGCAASCGCSSP